MKLFQLFSYVLHRGLLGFVDGLFFVIAEAITYTKMIAIGLWLYLCGSTLLFLSSTQPLAIKPVTWGDISQIISLLTPNQLLQLSLLAYGGYILMRLASFILMPSAEPTSDSDYLVRKNSANAEDLT